MKFKTACRPQYNPWVKNISKLLAVGVLFNSISFNSFAGILSEDGRYEIFEGNNITIDNILEEDKVDVEIEGNTMVNVANQKDPVPITKSYTVEGANHIPLQGEYDGKARPVIEGNTMYYNNDTGELTDTFVEGANLSLASSFEDQLITQEMVDSGLEKAENLGKYKVQYKVTGKNKFTGELERGYGYADKGLTTSGYQEYLRGTELIPVEENNYYSLSFRDDNNYVLKNQYGYLCFDTNKKLFTSIGCNNKIPLGTKYILPTFKTSQNPAPLDCIQDIQIEKGNIQTEYEPYKESIKTFYLNSPLLEGDTIEDVDGKATHVRRYNEVIFDGSNDEGWHENSFTPDDRNALFRHSYRIIPPLSSTSNVICDKFKKSPNSINYTTHESILHDGWGIYLGINKEKLETEDTEGFVKWLSENPITVVYELATPVYETISEESILIDSYKDGHLDLNTDIPINKVDFISTTTNLNYLYPSTEYTIQFESDNKGKVDKVSLGDEGLYSNYTVNQGINRFNIITPSEISSTELILDGIGFNLSNLVVTEAVYESFDYFEGIKSVGQDDVSGHNIEVIYKNRNEWEGKDQYKNNINNSANILTYEDNECIFEHNSINQGLRVDISKYTGKDIVLSYNVELLEGSTINFGGHNRHTQIAYYIDGVKQSELYHDGASIELEIGRTYRVDFVVHINEIDPNFVFDYSHIGIEPNRYSNDNPTYAKIKISNFQITQSRELSSYVLPVSNTLQIPLPEPLRSLPNGVKDRIVKRNGQWVIERNCGEVTLDGSDKWSYIFIRDLDKVIGFDVQYIDRLKIGGYTITDKLKKLINIDDSEGLRAVADSNKFICHISKSKLPTLDINGFKQWLSENPVTVVYQLATPAYEPLNIDSVLNTYLDVTHISNNSTIPANMKITIDRTINRATEAIELAKINPTVANISQARMWINLIDDSILKDQLQDEINSITNIDDLQLDRKTASSNLDVYIKSENMLSMSLNTNSITFDNYSGVEDMEMLNAVNISINSSLPYDLNAYMPTEITNYDGSNTIDFDILNIKESSESTYQQFADTINKVVLKSDCTKGNGNIHNIDLKLDSNAAHKADVYKTVIKFEAEQK